MASVVVNGVDTYSYQYYFNRKGKPLSNDFIVYEKNRRSHFLAWSYYYQLE